jgi:tetratricopeptide (TPR) repeat protein
MAAADPANAPARLYLGLRRLREGRPGEAEALLREAVALDPRLAPAQNALGNVLSPARPGEAVAHFRAAIAAEPGHPIARYDLAVALLRLGRRKEAVEALREELAVIARARAARPDNALRRELGLEPDEARTRRLLDAVERAAPAR